MAEHQIKGLVDGQGKPVVITVRNSKIFDRVVTIPGDTTYVQAGQLDMAVRVLVKRNGLKPASKETID